MMTATIIMGLYPYIRDGVRHPFLKILQEIPRCLELNPWYRDQVVFLASDAECARILAGHGLSVTRTFDDAPEHVWRNTAHRMKHWMSLWALRTYGEYLWVDWDTLSLAVPDEPFWEFCRACGTPKFIRIPGYKHAVVNCGVTYAPLAWADAMERSFAFDDVNDEHLWEHVLPGDVLQREEFWFADHVQHIGRSGQFPDDCSRLYFAHLAQQEVAESLRAAHKRHTLENSICH